MTARPIHPEARQLVPLLAAAALIGLALRIGAARGDYWLDEAWSAVFARDAGTPGGVFFAINHDNNHFLNSLWLQFIGWGAPPMLGRALSIACGTAGVVVAGLIGARRSLLAAGVSALLFAVSPILVTYGSEARGYAPMLLALLTAIWIVDRKLFGNPLQRSPEWLGLIALLGMLGHVSMLFGVAALTGWVAIEHKRSLGLRAAAIETVRLMGRAIVAAIAVLLIVLVGATASPDGFRVGSLTAFSYGSFLDALAYMLAFALGWPLAVGLWLTVILLVPVALWRRPGLRDRAPFFLVAIIGLPLLVALLQPDNSAFPRYYLLSAVALLLLIADLTAAPSGPGRWPAAAALAALLAGSMAINLCIIRNQRGDPGAAIEAMKSRLAAGAAVLLDNPRDSAVLEAGAAARDYRLRITNGCADARFLFFERNGTAPFPRFAKRCGQMFRPIASGHVYGLSGMDWQLYESAR